MASTGEMWQRGYVPSSVAAEARCLPLPALGHRADAGDIERNFRHGQAGRLGECAHSRPMISDTRCWGERQTAFRALTRRRLQSTFSGVPIERGCERPRRPSPPTALAFLPRPWPCPGLAEVLVLLAAGGQLQVLPQQLPTSVFRHSLQLGQLGDGPPPPEGSAAEPGRGPRRSDQKGATAPQGYSCVRVSLPLELDRVASRMSMASCRASDLVRVTPSVPDSVEPGKAYMDSCLPSCFPGDGFWNG